MSEVNLDGIAWDPGAREVAMLMVDTEGWDDEPGHLLRLQGRLNGYAAVVETGAWRRLLPEADPEPAGFRIVLSFMEPVTEGCVRLLQVAAAQLGEELGISIEATAGE